MRRNGYENADTIINIVRMDYVYDMRDVRGFSDQREE